MSAALSPLAAAQHDALSLTNDAATTAYLSAADSPTLRPQRFTIEAWVRPTGPGIGNTGDQHGASILAKPEQGAGGTFLSSWWLQWAPSSQHFEAGITHRIPDQGVFLHGQRTVAQGESAHVALTFDGSVAALYVDGALDATAAVTWTTVAYTTSEVLLGAGNFCCGYLRRFDGELDEVRVWDAALDAASVASSAFCEAPAHGATLLARWRFDGGALTDSSGNGNDLVPTGTGVGVAPPLVVPGVGCGPLGVRYCTPARPGTSRRGTATPSAAPRPPTSRTRSRSHTSEPGTTRPTPPRAPETEMRCQAPHSCNRCLAS